MAENTVTIPLEEATVEERNRIIKGQRIDRVVAISFDQKILLEQLDMLRSIKSGISFFVVITIIGFFLGLLFH